MRGLTPAQVDSVYRWFRFYRESPVYPYVGLVSGHYFSESGSPTYALRAADRALLEHAERARLASVAGVRGAPECAATYSHVKGGFLSCKSREAVVAQRRLMAQAEAVRTGKLRAPTKLRQAYQDAAAAGASLLAVRDKSGLLYDAGAARAAGVEEEGVPKAFRQQWRGRYGQTALYAKGGRRAGAGRAAAATTASPTTTGRESARRGSRGLVRSAALFILRALGAAVPGEGGQSNNQRHQSPSLSAMAAKEEVERGGSPPHTARKPRRRRPTDAPVRDAEAAGGGRSEVRLGGHTRVSIAPEDADTVEIEEMPTGEDEDVEIVVEDGEGGAAQENKPGAARAAQRRMGGVNAPQRFTATAQGTHHAQGHEQGGGGEGGRSPDHTVVSTATDGARGEGEGEEGEEDDPWEQEDPLAPPARFPRRLLLASRSRRSGKYVDERCVCLTQEQAQWAEGRSSNVDFIDDVAAGSHAETEAGGWDREGTVFGARPAKTAGAGAWAGVWRGAGDGVGAGRSVVVGTQWQVDAAKRRERSPAAGEGGVSVAVMREAEGEAKTPSGVAGETAGETPQSRERTSATVQASAASGGGARGWGSSNTWEVSGFAHDLYLVHSPPSAAAVAHRFATLHASQQAAFANHPRRAPPPGQVSSSEPSLGRASPRGGGSSSPQEPAIRRTFVSRETQEALAFAVMRYPGCAGNATDCKIQEPPASAAYHKLSPTRAEGTMPGMPTPHGGAAGSAYGGDQQRHVPQNSPHFGGPKAYGGYPSSGRQAPRQPGMSAESAAGATHSLFPGRAPAGPSQGSREREAEPLRNPLVPGPIKPRAREGTGRAPASSGDAGPSMMSGAQSGALHHGGIGTGGVPATSGLGGGPGLTGVASGPVLP